MDDPQFPFLGMPWLRTHRDIACCRCRRRKKKCDKRRPVCGECSRAGADCVPLIPKKSAASKHPSAGYVHLLEEHVATLETRLRQSNPSIAEDHFAGQSPGADTEMPDNAIVANLNDLEPIRTPPESALLLESPQGGVGDQDWLFNPFEDAEDALGRSPGDGRSVIWPASMHQLDSPSQHRVVEQEDEDEDVEDIAVDPQLGAPASIINTASTRVAESYLSLSVASRYASEYFTSAHPMWPFLHHKQWDEWWTYWTGPTRADKTSDWRAFFVEMVLSVGGLLVHSATPSPDHMSLSKAAYQRAMTRYNAYPIQEGSPTLKTQSSLLLTVHAMHLDSVGELFDRASEAIKNCALSDLAYHRSKMKRLTSGGSDLEDVIHKMTLRTCVVIDILLSNSMDHAVCFNSSSVQDDDFEDYDDQSISSEELRLSYPNSGVTPSPTDIALEEHMFRLRRIQYRILRITQRLEYKASTEDHPVPNLWRSRPKHDLDQWIHGISALRITPERQKRFLSEAWLLKLANYTVISLFPNPSLAVRGGDSRHLVAAACSVLITFRRLRVKDDTTCYTWTALLHQFQAAVSVVFCLWATPTHQQLEFYDRRAVCQALFAALATLVEFSNKWAAAQVFREIFELLTEALPVTEYGDSAQQWTISPSHAKDLEQLIPELQGLKVQRKVVTMLNKILRGPRPVFTPLSVAETQWIQYEYIEEPR
ncbi:hypothetical protein BKA56DRAFT_598405 [Ilyonectria sp. MPI-CAGE-AT-0026]|nr:hypothetical protein BKA56DRAFT_598405 [Ilyonectria sp. MPI-CAGE-AT-0026]